jgi:ribonuclease VapC
MILDSSAIVAVIRREHGYASLVSAMESASRLMIGAPALHEARMLLIGHFGVLGSSLLSRFIEERQVEVLPFDDRHLRLADEAGIRFGRGRHLAGLDPCDCMTYAVARAADAPLLFAGDSFARTDLEAA